MICFRVDMNDTIATGHMMRCLAIADAVRASGKESLFIVSDNEAARLLERKKYSYVILDTKWNDMESEIPKLEQIICEQGIEKIVIDSYMVTEKYLKFLTERVCTIYIDDLNAFKYPVNVIVCYANYADKFRYEERYEHTKFLLGTRYVPLRHEFKNCKQKKIKAVAANLLLICGGTDEYHVVENILSHITIEKFERINAICGAYSEDYPRLLEMYKKYDNVNIMRSVPNIKKYYDFADLVISAAGTALYELCAVGTPAICYTIADNQIDNAKRFDEDGIIEYAGDVRRDDYVGKIIRFVNDLQSDEKRRKEKTMAMRELVDGNGAERIVRELFLNDF